MRCCVAEPLHQKCAAGPEIYGWSWQLDCGRSVLPSQTEPHRLGVDLEQKEAKSLVKKTVSVIQKACSVDADKDRFPARGCSTTAGARSKGLDRQRRIDSIRRHRWTHDRLGARPSELRCVAVGMNAADHMRITWAFLRWSGRRPRGVWFCRR